MNHYDNSTDATWQARQARSRLRGGAAHVGARDTISAGGCWCGKPQNHGWPGMEQGAPHPREEKQVATMSNEPNQKIQVRDLKKWDRNVARFIADLVNDYGVRYRLDRNEMHIFLYAPNGERPFKAAASRAAEVQLRHLEKFARDQVAPHLITTQAELLAARFNDPSKKVRRAAVKAATEPVAPEPTPVPEAPQEPVPVSPDPTGDPVIPFVEQDKVVEGNICHRCGDPRPDTSRWCDGCRKVMEPKVNLERTRAVMSTLNNKQTAPEGYEQWYGEDKNLEHPSKHDPLNWWKKIGWNEWRCKSCDYVFTGDRLYGGHQRAHTLAKRKEPTVEPTVAAPVITEPSRQAKAARTRKVRKAVAMLAEATGVDLSADSSKIERQRDKALADLAKMTRERDDLKAKLDLIREGLRA